MIESQLRQFSILVGQKLKEKRYWITCAESCTGGGITKAITDTAGSSAYLDRGFVTYSNAAKQDLLGVKEATLTIHGAVSAEVVREMAVGALHAANADLAIAVSGFAGPQGGGEGKPVGTVWFGFAEGNRVLLRKKHFVGDRAAVRLKTAIFALRTIFEEML
ncbi:Nicotinamide-nucleotide amidohydrolase PncC [Serratia symbiotica]|nr:Nicotinamide-nucleotide amidohydrolase PncC [Serratia symbiotica]